MSDHVGSIIQVAQGIAQAPVVVSNTCRGRDEANVAEEEVSVLSNVI